MAPNNLSELDKYAAEANDLQARVEELAKFGQQRDQFDSLNVSLTLERKTISADILDSSAPNGYLEQLDRIDKSIKLNGASAQALGERIAAREKYLHERVPLAIATFFRLRNHVVNSVLKTCHRTVTGLIDPSVLVAEEDINKIVVAMPEFVKISRLRLPSTGWQMERPLDAQKPTPWTNLARPFTDEEWAQQRAETVKAIIQATNELLRACGPLLKAARGYGEPPKFVCEPEVQTPPESHPEWNEPIATDRMKQICEEAGKRWEDLTPDQMKILADADAANDSTIKAQRIWTGVPEPEGA